MVEADHGKLKRLIRPTLGFKTLKTAYATLKGFEVMNALRKGQADLWCYGRGIIGEALLITASTPSDLPSPVTFTSPS